MAKGFYAQIVEELARLGYAYVRNAKGSHEIWRNAEGRQTTVPRNLKSRHTANAILKSVGSALKL